MAAVVFASVLLPLPTWSFHVPLDGLASTRPMLARIAAIAGSISVRVPAMSSSQRSARV
jgi:hypothetical protein